MSNERIEAIRKELDNNYGVHSVPPNPIEGAMAFPNARGHVRYLLDHIAALEAVAEAAGAVRLAYARWDRQGVTPTLPMLRGEVQALIDALDALGQGENEKRPGSA